MNVLFLDVDGVLNSNCWNGTHKDEINKGILIDEKRIILLSKLVVQTECKIILHSGWKYWFDEYMIPLRKEAKILKDTMEWYGITIDGVTPDLASDEIKKTKKFSLVKADEILEWLSLNPDTDAWVVFDDLNLHNAEVNKHQIMTNCEIGLTDFDIEKAKRLFSMQQDCLVL